MGTRCHSQVSFPVWFSYPCLTSASRFPRRAPATCGRPFLPFCSDYSHPCPPLVSRLEKESAPGAHGNMIERSHAELTDGGVRIDLCFYSMSLSLFQVCAHWKLRRFHFQWCPHAFSCKWLNGANISTLTLKRLIIFMHPDGTFHLCWAGSFWEMPAREWMQHYFSSIGQKKNRTWKHLIAIMCFMC